MLTIDDPQAAASIGLPAYDALTWRWRVYLPAEKRFRLMAQCNQIPAKETLDQMSPAQAFRLVPSEFLTAGEQMIVVHIRQEARQKPVVITSVTPSSPTGLPSKSRSAALTANGRQNGGSWPDGPDRGGVSLGTESQMHVAGKNEPYLILLRHRVPFPGGPNDGMPVSSTDGLMVWLEEIEQEDAK